MTNDEVTGMIYLIAVIFIYLIPTVVAYDRSHHQTAAILLTNVLLGWTFIGWVVALIWSATAVQKKVQEAEQ